MRADEDGENRKDEGSSWAKMDVNHDKGDEKKDWIKGKRGDHPWGTRKGTAPGLFKQKPKSDRHRAEVAWTTAEKE